MGQTPSALIAQVATTPATVQNGFGPGINPLTIGSVTFNSSECPSDLEIGGSQMVVEKTLVGGARVVQTFGPTPDPITWTGKLFGPYVAARIAQMRLYRDAGNPITLSWKKSNYAATGNALQNGLPSTPLAQVQEKYIVVIKDFKPKFYAQYASYTITLTVTKSLNGTYAGASPQTIDAQINALQSAATTLTQQIATDSGVQAAAVAQSVNGVNSAINAATPVSQNPLAGPNIQQTIQTAQTALSAYQSLQPSGSSSLATAIRLNGVLTALSRNVALGYSPQTVQQQGGNIFTIASQYYGDVYQAFSLAKIAGFPSPFLPSGLFNSIPLPKISSTPPANQGTA